jgi:Leucine-rich repeat (LRR) protein
VQTLDVSRNKIGYIVSEIGNLTDIRHLRLSQMDLDTLPPEIGFCNKLQTIDLTGNPIDNLPETLVECRQLYEMKINFKTFYKLLDNYMLQLIDEGKIHSEHIPQVLFELENLQILDLNETKLNSIPNQHTLNNLNELYLSNNSFFDIPQSICTMEQLKILDMSNNRIQTIPDYFVNTKRLEILILSYNNLTNLSNNITRLLTLKKLIVSHNQINSIENGFSQGQSLLTLDMSYNSLKEIPDELCNLKQLETLDLRYNQLEYLPLSIRQMTGLKSMNTFDDDFQRFGLHLLGNPITDPPSYIWKSTCIQTLFDYIETKEKILSNNFYHLKLILIGPKHTGKTSLTIKLLDNQKTLSNTQKTLDTYVSLLQEKQIKLDEQAAAQGLMQQRSSDITSSVLTDQWIENRISTNDDHFLNRTSKVKRIFPPPLKTYRSNELFENVLNKSTLITKNNFYCTIFDLTSEPTFEILYPLIYDSNALVILPVNLTILLDIVQAATSLENFNE